MFPFQEANAWKEVGTLCGDPRVKVIHKTAIPEKFKLERKAGPRKKSLTLVDKRKTG
jgi:hypothetical protein